MSLSSSKHVNHNVPGSTSTLEQHRLAFRAVISVILSDRHSLLYRLKHGVTDIKLLLNYTFLSFTAIILAGYLGGCWSLSQLHAAEGRVTPLPGPYLNIWMLGTLLKGTSARVLGTSPATKITFQLLSATRA